MNSMERPQRSVLEAQLQKFLESVGPLHANNVAQDLPAYIPLMKRFPHLVAPELKRFRTYFEAPAHNHVPALHCLTLLAREIPELRDAIVDAMGDVLYEYKELIHELPYGGNFLQLLQTLEVPVSLKDALIKQIARSISKLKQPAIVVIGAGFSYDSMPITNEIANLLVPILKEAGIDDPMRLIRENDKEVWKIVQENQNKFKERFVGRCSNSQPAAQHKLVSEMLHDGEIGHLISFNWDDLIERAYLELYAEPIPKITKDGNAPVRPSLWKLHGDVEDMNDEWVFPYHAGKVFSQLQKALEESTKTNPPSYALIVGYSEYEPEVKDKLISWLEKHVPNVVRIRPSLPDTVQNGIRDSAKRFFQRLGAYKKLAQRQS